MVGHWSLPLTFPKDVSDKASYRGSNPCIPAIKYRRVAQSGSAHPWGGWGHPFKSDHADQIFIKKLLTKKYITNMKRSIVVNFKDGSKKELEVSRATAIRADAGMLHLDKLKDDTWRLTYSEDITKDFKEIDSLTVHRED
jgi:hypothetical protein